MAAIVSVTERSLASVPVGCRISRFALPRNGISSYRPVEAQACLVCGHTALMRLSAEVGMNPQTISWSQMSRIPFLPPLAFSPLQTSPGVSRRFPIVVATSDPTQTDGPANERGQAGNGSGTVVKDGARKRSSSEPGVGFGATVPARGRKGAAVPAEVTRQPGSSGERKTREQKEKTGSARRPAPESPLIGAEAGDSSAVAREVETAAVIGLGFLFLAVFAEGVFLAVSGFLPDEWDAFAVEKVYPSFTPTIGVFLLGSSLYGLYNFLGKKPKS